MTTINYVFQQIVINAEASEDNVRTTLFNSVAHCIVIHVLDNEAVKSFLVKLTEEGLERSTPEKKRAPLNIVAGCKNTVFVAIAQGRCSGLWTPCSYLDEGSDGVELNVMSLDQIQVEMGQDGRSVPVSLEVFAIHMSPAGDFPPETLADYFKVLETYMSLTENLQVVSAFFSTSRAFVFRKPRQPHLSALDNLPQ